MTNVFVLNTGRCGSTTFTRACRHFTNFTAGHETRTRRLGPARFAYPANHIEADNRLAWLLGRLERAYGDRAHYVHLSRDRDAVIESFARRARYGIMRAYGGGGIIMGLKGADPHDLAADYVDTVTENIAAFLAGKSNAMQIRLERAAEAFPGFAGWIGAEGDLDAATAEFAHRYNAAPPRK